MRTRTKSPGARPSPSGMITRPSISGASPGERASAPSSFDLVDQHGHLAVDLGLEALGGDVFLEVHQARTALLAHLVRHRARQLVGRRTLDRRIGEGADAVELGLFEEVQQQLEVFLGLAREAGDEGRADGELGADAAPLAHALEHVLGVGRALHGLEDARAGVLEGHVQVGQDLALGHQRDQVVHARIGIHVVHADPDAELAERLGQIEQARLDRAPAPEAGAVLDVHPVGRGVLRDHQDLLDAGVGERLGLAHDLVDRPADQVAAHRRDDAEAAAVVAAFGDLEVGVVLRREPDALRRHEVGEGVVRLGQVAMHRVHDLLGGVRAGDREHLGVRGEDHVVLGAEAAGDDHLAVLGERLADRVERLLDRGVDEAAGIDDDQVGVVVAARDRVALGAQPGQDVLGVDGRLGAAEGNEADARQVGGLECGHA